MPNSASSLEPLSSPSPSPPPEAKASSSKDRDNLSDSELSELTEDEHDSESNKNKRPVGRKMLKSAKEGSPSDLPPLRNNTRRKRGGIVPAPMWEWAKRKKGSPQSVEDEDETESSGSELPPEEEDPPTAEDVNMDIDPALDELPKGAHEKTVVDEAVAVSALGDLADTAIASTNSPTVPPPVDALSSLADSILAQEGANNTLMSPPEPVLQVAAASIMAGPAATPPISRSTSPSASPPPIHVSVPEKKPTPTKPGLNGVVQSPVKAGGLHLEVHAPEPIAFQVSQSPAILDDAEKDEDLGPDAEIESDVQPAHRAEALDVLAAIELKFALLRERVYVEKMAALAWEESLVNDGIHPEMTYLHEELSKRKDIRLQLASRKRDYELMNATKRRRADEDAVWSWWKLARDELQTTMIAETNRKRRKLERERRAIDRLQPVRMIPEPSQDIPPVLPSFKDIVKEAAEGTCVPAPWSDLATTAYPDLHTLSHEDVAFDLSLIFQDRRTHVETQRFGPAGVHGMISDEGHLPNPVINPVSSNGIRSHILNPPINEVYPGHNANMYDQRPISPPPPSAAPAPIHHEQWSGSEASLPHIRDDGQAWPGPKRHDPHHMDEESKAHGWDRDRRDYDSTEYRDIPHTHLTQHPRRPPQQPHHHTSNPHHHHHHHHHHIVHHHHSQQNPVPSHPHTPLSAPPGPAGPVHSPRSLSHSDFDRGRPRSGPGQPAELINLSSKHPTPTSQWKHDTREREPSTAEIENKMTTLPPIDDRDRPMAMPFVMASSHTMQSVTSANTNPSSGSRSPRSSWHSREDDPAYRMAPPTSSYHASHEQYPTNRYGGSSQSSRVESRPPNSNTVGLSPPRHRQLQPPQSPSSASNNYARSPPRYNAPPPPPPSHSPVLNKGHHGGSPVMRTSGSSSNLYSQNATGGHRTITPVDAKNTQMGLGNGRMGSPFVPLYAPSPPPSQPQAQPPPQPQLPPPPSRNVMGPAQSHAQDTPSTPAPTPSRSLASLLAPAPPENR